MDSSLDVSKSKSNLNLGTNNYERNLLLESEIQLNKHLQYDLDIKKDFVNKENMLLGSKPTRENMTEKLYNGAVTIDERDSDYATKMLPADSSGIVVAKEKSNVRNYPPCNSGNIIKTAAAYVTFLGGGMGNSIFGATILHLEAQTDSTTQQIAPIFLWRALGSFIGNMAVAFLFDTIPPEIILIIGCTVLAAMNLTIPWCTSFTMLMAVTVIHGLSHGSLGGGCNSYVVKTWRLKSAPFIQGLHFITSFGSMLTPLIVDLFVHDIETHPDKELNSLDNNRTSLSMPQNGDGFAHQDEMDVIITNYNLSYTANETNTNEETDSNIFIPFLFAAIVVFLGALTFALSLCLDIMHHRKSLNRVDSFIASQKEPKLPIKNKPIFVMMLVFISIYGGIECTYGSWILAFVVKYLNASFETGALICTCYWGSLAGGRAIGIITTKLFQPELLIIICLVVSMISLLVLTFACTLHISVTWACSILVGLSFASIFGNCIAFCQRELNISGRTTSVLSMCLYVGFMSMPALVGLLFAHYTPMFFPYILTGSSITITVIFSIIILYTKCCKKET